MLLALAQSVFGGVPLLGAWGEEQHVAASTSENGLSSLFASSGNHIGGTITGLQPFRAPLSMGRGLYCGRLALVDLYFFSR